MAGTLEVTGDLRLAAVDREKSWVDGGFGKLRSGSEGEGASAIVRAITELAHALNIETTAEGVEETAQLMELRAHGCSSVQGFLFAGPMSAADIDRLFGEDRGSLQGIA